MIHGPDDIDSLRRENAELRRLIAAIGDQAAAVGADWALRLIDQMHPAPPESAEWFLSIQGDLNLSDIAANIPGAVYQYLQKPDGTQSFPYLSPAAEKLFDVPFSFICDPDWVIGHIHPDDLPGYFASVAEATKNLERWTQEMRVIKPNGQTIWVFCSSSPRLLPDGSIIWNGVILDITQYKQAVGALKESEDRLRLLVKNSSDILVIIDSDGTQRYVSPSAERITGFTASELMGKSLAEIIHPDDMENISTAWTEAVEHPERLVTVQYRHIHKTKGWVHLEARGQNLEAEPSVGGFVANVRDITDRIRTEEELLARSQEMKVITDNMRDTVWLMDLDFRTTWISPSVIRTRGYTLAELAGMPLERHLTPDSLAKITTLIAEHMTPERLNDPSADITVCAELEFYRKDGSTFWADTVTNVLRDSHGRPSSILGVSRDVTERKLVEEALRKSEETFRNVVEAAPMGIHLYQLEADDRLVFAGFNPAADRLLGTDHSRFIGRTVEEAFPSLRETEVPERYRAVARMGENWRTEQINYHDGGIAGAFEVYAFQMSPGKTAVMFNDITARKQAEDSLKRSEEKFKALAEYSVDVIMRFDRQHRHLYVNPAAEAQTGLKPDEFIGKTHKELGFPADLVNSWDKAIEQVFVTSAPHQIEFQLPNGSWIDWLLTPEFSDDGKVSAVIASARDITVRKRAEEALEKRMVALVRPLDSPEGVDIEDLFNLKDLQRLQDEFAYATGVASIITHTDGRPITAPSNFCRLCSEIIRKTEVGLANCYRSDAVIGRACLEGPTIQPCLSGGLWDAGAGITVGGRHIANWLIGQVRDETQSTEKMRAYARKIGVDEETVAEAFLEVPAMNRDQFEKVSQALFTLASQLSASAYQNVQQARFITEIKRAGEERQKLQEQLNQAQKMESVGRLAGGVAHDFNNMLGGILGYTEMALEQVDPAHPIHGDLLQIKKATERSAELTRQLLGFARQQTVAPRMLDLNETVEGMLKMLRRIIGEDIDLAWLPGKNLGTVKIDPAQIDQLLANLCINAKDAMGASGKVTIETDNAVFDETYCAGQAGSVPGEYVMLAVSDNGCGMDRETAAKIFEPFFTTKEVGKGTGLGLATVYGIVKQNEGHINVYSEPGHGSTFRIYLPRHEAKADHPAGTDAAKPSSPGHETILVVEDEPIILESTTKMLKRQGYRVLAASTPVEAIRIARENHGEIHLLMTDVVMPEMNGRDLAKNLLSLYPKMKRLFMSGYTANVIAHHGVLEEGMHFLQKPFNPKGLYEKVREALNSD